MFEGVEKAERRIFIKADRAEKLKGAKRGFFFIIYLFAHII